MPTRKEAEEFKEMLQKEMLEIQNSNLPDNIKDELLNIYLDKWKAAHEALLGLGIPLED
jgi:hypothetical protein